MAGQKSSFSIHMGKTLLKLASTYPKLVDVVYECIQNALDSMATVIMIKADYKTRTLTICDNGDGVSVDKFNKALTSVGHTIKREDSLGQFGLGLISPLGKCEEFTFTSTYKSSPTNYKSWHFVTKDIEDKEKVEFIPMEDVNNLMYVLGSNSKPFNKTNVPWRTQVRLDKFTTDRMVSKIDLENLQEEVLVRFGAKMRKLNTLISLKLKRQNDLKEEVQFSAPEFNGEPLPIQYYDRKGDTEALFEMFLARKTAKGRHGLVHVGIKFNDYRIGFKIFSEAHKLLKPETVEIFASGIFEGTILSKGCTLAKERTYFVENDQLVAFCKHIDTWAASIGSKYFKKINDEKQDERYQKLGLKSLEKLKTMLENPYYQSFHDVLKDIKEGTIGPGHKDFNKARTFNDFTEMANVLEKEGTFSPPENESGERGHQDNRVHHTAQGPRGTLRKIVKHQGVGLRLIYEEMLGKSVLWEFESKSGILRFNIRHPLWARAEKKDKWLMQFQELIAIAALTVQIMPVAQRNVCQQFAQEQIKGALFFIENA